MEFAVVRSGLMGWECERSDEDDGVGGGEGQHSGIPIQESTLRRWIVNLLSLASLLLACSIGVLWLRSHRLADTWQWKATTAPGGDKIVVGRVWDWGIDSGGVWFRNTASSFQLDSAAEFQRDRYSDFVKYSNAPAGSYPMFPPVARSPDITNERSVIVDLWGFGLGRTAYVYKIVHGRIDSTSIFIPLWFVMAIFLLYPALREIHRFQERKEEKRRQAGLCANCGYDLRASKERCPECGTAIRADSEGGCETTAI